MRRGRNAELGISAAERLQFRNIFDGSFGGVTRRGERIVLDLKGEPVYVHSNMTGQRLAVALNRITVNREP